ncbi:unnamed protein product [Bursaphelenchus xylophilus]|uniref:(pine wood nematode) hypothetical protein n=1 Tax=Bursaphelenchus xylophilus TaxID=6326 RepID=A0A1I7SSQ8_BURXY|nr:unnamed protein product [Bursaphelenchus xylophilus]CAG9108915.1 unnamed protein product [Bursaphelenchus xylophilus]
MDFDTLPCKDFYRFASRKFDPELRQTTFDDLIKKILTDETLSNHIESIKRVKGIYQQCLKNPKTLIDIGMSTKAQNAQTQINVTFPVKVADVSDDTGYMKLLFRMYKILFEYGNEIFIQIKETLEAGYLQFNVPDNILEDSEKEEIWKTYCQYQGCDPKKIDFASFYPFSGKYKKMNLTDADHELINDVFGARIDMKFIRFPVADTVEDRTKLINQLFETWLHTPHVAPPVPCEFYMQYTYPLYINKLLVDYYKNDTVKFQKLHDNFFNLANAIVQEAENTFRFSNVLKDDMKELTLKQVNGSRFAFFNHSIYEDNNFVECCNLITEVNPAASVYVNNLRPLAKFNHEKQEKYWYLPLVNNDAAHYGNINGNFFNWGVFMFHLYDNDFPPVITMSGSGWVMAHELAHAFGTQLRKTSEDYAALLGCLIEFYADQCFPIDPTFCVDPMDTMEENFADVLGAKWAYLAYKKWASVVGTGERPRGEYLDTISDDQLFFINMVQSMVDLPGWSLYYPGAQHAPRPVRVWGALANLPSFASAFTCEPGDVYNPGFRCSLFDGPIKVNKNLTDPQ